ncbi:MAG: hypothetical protein BWX88_01824 [Planctomycetes bacterium ADurb.Bin126]|nr:MAG: hypothetical protein BWX88_01824 [Planctomycetes bacterium ADurb.Bin126]
MNGLNRRGRQGGILTKLIVLIVVVVGSIVGYRVLFMQETPSQALKTLTSQAAEKISELREGDSLYEKGDWRTALDRYRRVLAPGTKQGERLPADRLRHARGRVCESLYRIAEESKWEPAKCQEAIEAVADFLAKYPDLSTEVRTHLQDRLTELRSHVSR